MKEKLGTLYTNAKQTTTHLQTSASWFYVRNYGDWADLESRLDLQHLNQVCWGKWQIHKLNLPHPLDHAETAQMLLPACGRGKAERISGPLLGLPKQMEPPQVACAKGRAGEGHRKSPAPNSLGPSEKLCTTRRLIVGLQSHPHTCIRKEGESSLGVWVPGRWKRAVKRLALRAQRETRWVAGRGRPGTPRPRPEGVGALASLESSLYFFFLLFVGRLANGCPSFPIGLATFTHFCLGTVSSPGHLAQGTRVATPVPRDPLQMPRPFPTLSPRPLGRCHRLGIGFR